MKCWRKQ